MDDISPHPINVGLWCLDHQNINHCKDVNVPTSTNQLTIELGLDSGEILPNPMILAPLHIPPFPIVSLLFWIKKKKTVEISLNNWLENNSHLTEKDKEDSFLLYFLFRFFYGWDLFLPYFLAFSCFASSGLSMHWLDGLNLDFKASGYGFEMWH